MQSNRNVKRKQRCLLFAKTQQMYSKNRSRLAKSIFDGEDIIKEIKEMPIDLQFKYWSELISKPSIPFNHLFVNNSNAYIHPITINEVKSCYGTLHDGAPGIDGLKKCDLTKIGPNNITARFNIYLISSTAPSAFKLGLTSLIPKTKHSTEPSHYRPITMSSIFCRLLHKMLARRIENTISLNPRQKYFVRRDGIADNIFLLKSIIYQHKNALRPLKMCLLDVSKAFDTVSQNSIVALAERVGTPKMYTSYIMHTYSDCSTQLKYKNGVSPSIPVNRGVKQGDPMSPALFNSIIDYVTDNMPGSINLQGNSTISHMEFADDLVLFAKDDVMMQYQVDHVLFRLAQCGLNVNKSKCATLNIIINPKKKQWICNPYSFISIDNSTIKELNIEDTYRYLGINIGALDNKNNSINDDLTSKLLAISKSTLKPQQKLFMLKNHLIPSMLHTLTFSNVYLNSLKTMDRSIRAFVRRCLRLPSDTSLGVFYAPSSVGGIAITRLFLAIPVLRLKRISSIRRNDDTIIQTLPYRVILKWSTPRVYDEYTFIDNTSINKYHSIYLFNSVDGKGLELGTHSPFINNWITSPIKMFSGRDFVDMVKLKHGLLYTHYRCKRMFPSLNTNCLRRGCNYIYDCLNHIMQTCRFNYNNIIHRHNYVNALLITLLNKYKFTTIGTY